MMYVYILCIMILEKIEKYATTHSHLIFSCMNCMLHDSVTKISCPIMQQGAKMNNMNNDFSNTFCVKGLYFFLVINKDLCSVYRKN